MKLKLLYSLLLGVVCVFLTQDCDREPVVSPTSKVGGVDMMLAVPNTTVNFHYLVGYLRVLMASR